MDVIKQLEEALQLAERILIIFKTIRTEPPLSAFYTRPAFDMLINGVNFLVANLKALIVKVSVQRETEA